MLGIIARRILFMIPTVVVISIVTFAIIQLPPGDYLDTLAAELGDSGGAAGSLEALRQQYGLGQPLYVQYFKWIQGILLEGNFGLSFEKNVPVNNLIWDRLGWTFAISFLTLIFIWVTALPIGINSAVKRYSFGDHVATFFSFIGLAIPNFLLALLMMYVAFKYFGQSFGTSGAAALIRIMRANLLEELYRPYVVTARAKGISEFQLQMKYPVRVALNPFVSMIGRTSLAREVRGRFLSLRNEDFIIAAKLDGLTDWEVIHRHMVPSFASHIIASLTLAVPLMILAETSLSFLGIGLQPPIVSWGTLLKEAKNIRTISEAPWLLIAPGSVIVVAVLALNFLVDGLHDAADPHAY